MVPYWDKIKIKVVMMQKAILGPGGGVSESFPKCTFDDIGDPSTHARLTYTGAINAVVNTTEYLLSVIHHGTN